MDLNFQPFAEGVHDGSAHAVESAGDLVAAAAELSAGVQDGKNNLKSGGAGLFLDINGNAAAVIADADDVSFLDNDIYAVAEAGQCLVNGVVDNFIHQMVKPGRAGGTDIHTWPFSNGFQPLQNLYL